MIGDEAQLVLESDEFMKLSRDEMCDIIGRDSLCVDEIVIYEMVKINKSLFMI